MSLRRVGSAFAAVCLITAGLFASAPSAQAYAGPGPWAMDNCPNAYGCQSATVRVLPDRCEVQLSFRWSDRATRYARVESDWGRSQEFAYPNNRSVDTRLALVQPGWNMVHVWTVGHPARDVDRVVWAPSHCGA